MTLPGFLRQAPGNLALPRHRFFCGIPFENPMNSIIPAGLASALALFALAQNLPAEDAPAGALEKITAALPNKPFA